MFLSDRFATANMLIDNMTAYGSVTIKKGYRGYSVVWVGRNFTVHSGQCAKLRHALIVARNARLKL